jgi:hypothetical protein
VAYGLFHGLIFLPVVLSCVGRPPYASAKGAESVVSADVHEPKLEAVQVHFCELNPNSKKIVHTQGVPSPLHVAQIDGKRVAVGSVSVGFRNLGYYDNTDGWRMIEH